MGSTSIEPIQLLSNSLFIFSFFLDDGKLQFEEFYAFVGKNKRAIEAARELEREEYLRRIFKLADTDGNGTLSREEIMEIGAPVVTEADLPDHELEFEGE